MKQTKKLVRDSVLWCLKRSGAFELVKNSRWRQERLLILCYHGIALEDEHQWRPHLFVSRAQLEQRLEIMRRGKYSVLPLGQGIEKLYKGELPPGSVTLTFDDGTYDFYQQGYPALKSYGFPSTVYLTTYYTCRPYPVFHLICSYMLWKRRDLRAVSLGTMNLDAIYDLGKEDVRRHIERELLDRSERAGLSGDERNEVAAKLARVLELDYEELLAKRILQLMNKREISELASAGVDFQLHTHRHRMPLDEILFRREIHDNREAISNCVREHSTHFCYPSGAYRPEFLPWLSAEGVVSATTCDTGLATRESNPLLVPRFVDTTGKSALMFESWAAGVGQFLSLGKRGAQAYDPQEEERG